MAGNCESLERQLRSRRRYPRPIKIGVADLRDHLGAALDLCGKTGVVFFITVRGMPKAILRKYPVDEMAAEAAYVDFHCGRFRASPFKRK